MKLIAGLGNPGRKYDQTKHNTGFMVLDHYLEKNGLTLDKDKFEGLWTKQKINGEDVIFLEPQTFMNDSGKSIAQVANFFKIKPEDILVIHDDMDMPIGKIRIRANGKSGGHNGIKSIIENLHTQEFLRLKVGISKPENNIINYVLDKFSKSELDKLNNSQEIINNIISDFIDGATNDKLMNKYN